MGQICTQSVNKDPPTCPVTPHPFQSHFSLGLSGMSQFISQMHLQFGSKLLFLLKDTAHALRADVSHSLQESQTDLVCPIVIFLFPFLLFPFLKVIFTLPSYHSFFFFLHSFFSFHTPLWSPIVIQMLLSGEQQGGPFPWRIYRMVWLGGPGWWLQVSVRNEERVLELRRE